MEQIIYWLWWVVAIINWVVILFLLRRNQILQWQLVQQRAEVEKFNRELNKARTGHHRKETR